MERIDIKKQLLATCKEKIIEQIATNKKAMEEAQREANSHIGAMESRYDTFKQEAQALRDGYAMEIQKCMDMQKIINNIPLELTDTVHVGAVIETDGMNYFVAAHLFSEPLMLDSKKYMSISYSSPVCQSLAKRKKGDQVVVNGRTILIKDIY